MSPKAQNTLPRAMSEAYDEKFTGFLIIGDVIKLEC